MLAFNGIYAVYFESTISMETMVISLLMHWNNRGLVPSLSSYHVCLSVRTYVRTSVRPYVRTHVCMHVCVWLERFCYT